MQRGKQPSTGSDVQQINIQGKTKIGKPGDGEQGHEPVIKHENKVLVHLVSM